MTTWLGMASQAASQAARAISRLFQPIDLTAESDDDGANVGARGEQKIVPDDESDEIIWL